MTEIGKEYGTALFMLAVEFGEQKKYAESLELVKNAIDDDPLYLEMLSSSSIPLAERLDAIEKAFGEAVPEHVLSYLKLLCEKGRISSFTESVSTYKSLFEASERVSDVKITSAVELTEEEKQKLITKLEETHKLKVCAEYHIDENLLGGLMVEFDGVIMDGSLRHRLYDIKEVMST